MAYEVRITAEGHRHLDRLPDKIRSAAIEAVFSTIAVNPQRAGKALLGELEGLRSARRGDYRVIYEVDDAAKVVVVHRVQHRRDAYRSRWPRLSPARGSGRQRRGSGNSLRGVELPEHAPPWASPLVGALVDAGFVAGAETRGGMAGYSLAFRRGDCRVTLGGDRGDFDVWIELPNPRRGRGHPRRVNMPAEDYMAAERGDTDAALLLSGNPARAQSVAEWLARRAGDSGSLTLDAGLLKRIRALQRLRAKALFGSG